MKTQDLIAGYAAYTDAAELSSSHDQAAAITPTTATTASSAPCAASVGASIYTTVSKGC